MLSTGAALVAGPALARDALAAPKDRALDPVRGTDHARDKPAFTDGGPLDLPAWPYGDASTAPDAMLMFRGNPAHTFYGTGPVPDAPKVLWKHRMIDFETLYYGKPHTWSGTGWTGQAAYYAGYVFIGSQGRSFYAFEADTGKLRWRFDASRMIKSSVCVFDNKLYFGCVDDWLRCLDASTGRVLWRINTRRDLDSSACVVGGKLFIAGENGWARCLDPQTGEHHWRYFVDAINRGKKTGSYGSETSPAVVGDEYYTATYDGELFRLDARTGEKRWVAKTGDDTDASPVVWEDFVYTAAEEGSPHVFCFAREDGREVWRRRDTHGRGFWATPAVVDGALYITGHDNRCYALDARTGDERWIKILGSPSWSSPCVVDGRVIVGDFSGDLWCLDAKTGDEVWKLHLGGRIHSTPIIVNGRIYVGSGNGHFYAIG